MTEDIDQFSPTHDPASVVPECPPGSLPHLAPPLICRCGESDCPYSERPDALGECGCRIGFPDWSVAPDHEEDKILHDPPDLHERLAAAERRAEEAEADRDREGRSADAFRDHLARIEKLAEAAIRDFDDGPRQLLHGSSRFVVAIDALRAELEREKP